MADVEEFAGNCGMAILYSLGEGPEATLRAFLSSYKYDIECGDAPPSLVAFSDAAYENNNGELLARYIVANSLGVVTGCAPTKNLNSGNDIQAWYWAIDHEALAKWGNLSPDEIYSPSDDDDDGDW